MGGSGHPQDFPWQPNIWFVQHVPPPRHPAFFASSRLTLNVTRRDRREGREGRRRPVSYRTPTCNGANPDLPAAVTPFATQPFDVRQTARSLYFQHGLVYGGRLEVNHPIVLAFGR